MRSPSIHYALVGSFVIAAVAALLVSLATLTGRTTATERYSAVYDNVTGVAYGTRVFYEGYSVGQVERIEPLLRDGRQHFRVVLSVTEGWRIPTDSVAVIAMSGILTPPIIEIIGGDDIAVLAPGDELIARGSGNVFAAFADIAGQVGELSEEGLKPLLENLNRYLVTLGSTFEEEAPILIADLQRLIASLADKTPAVLARAEAIMARVDEGAARLMREENFAEIEATLSNVEAATRDLSTLTRDLDQTQALVNRLLSTVDRTVGENREGINRSLADLNHVLGTMARSVDSIAFNLEGTTRNMLEFSRQLRENPGLLIGGTRPRDGASLDRR